MASVLRHWVLPIPPAVCAATVEWRRGDDRLNVRNRWVTAWLVVVTMVVCVCAGAAAPAARATSAPPVYVALGDSIAAGEGIDNPPQNACHRSQSSYPYLLAADRKAFASAPTVLDVACTGASTFDVWDSQQQVNGATEQPQLAQLGWTSANVVTITAGLDDIPNWGADMAQCVADTVVFCDQQFGVAVKTAAAQVQRNLAVIISQLQTMPTHPRILVTGYYNPFSLESIAGSWAPDTSSCDKTDLNDLIGAYAVGGVAAIQGFEQEMNKAIQKVAIGDNVTYVNLWSVIPQLDRMCAPANWLFPMHVAAGAGDVAQFHPTLQGQQAIEGAVRKALRSPATPPTQTIAPSVGVDAGGGGGSVNEIAVSGQTAYIAGSFTRVGHSTGSGIGLTPTSDAPVVGSAVGGGSILAVTSDGSGGWYIGGTFTNIGGIPRTGLAHLLAYGQLDPNFDPALSDNEYCCRVSVDAITVADGSVYFGGTFDYVDSSYFGGNVAAVAAVDAVTGETLTWSATTTGVGDTVVSSLLSANGVVYVAGAFQSLNGAARNGLAAIDPSSGA